MLRVKVEIVPFGMESCAKELAEIIIINTGKGDHDIGEYRYTIEGTGADASCGEIHNFDRRRGSVELLKEVLLHSSKYKGSETSEDKGQGQDNGQG